jgi:hypothetical protein
MVIWNIELSHIHVNTRACFPEDPSEWDPLNLESVSVHCASEAILGPTTKFW